MYRHYSNRDGTINTSAIQRIADGASIPFDPANTDYQAFKAWLEEGNEPLPPDEGV